MVFDSKLGGERILDSVPAGMNSVEEYTNKVLYDNTGNQQIYETMSITSEEHDSIIGFDMVEAGSEREYVTENPLNWQTIQYIYGYTIIKKGGGYCANFTVQKGGHKGKKLGVEKVPGGFMLYVIQKSTSGKSTKPKIPQLTNPYDDRLRNH